MSVTVQAHFWWISAGNEAVCLQNTNCPQKSTENICIYIYEENIVLIGNHYVVSWLTMFSLDNIITYNSYAAFSLFHLKKTLTFPGG